MARDIHDTLAQGFTGVIMQLEAAQDAKAHGLDNEVDVHIARAGALARDSLNEARRSVLALRPLALERNNLCDALAILLSSMTAGSGVQSSFEVIGDARPLPPDWESALLHVGQEAITNCLRHAHATQCSLVIRFESSQLRLEFRDNGRGLGQSYQNSGFGLIGMRERVEGMGGNFVVQGALDPGMALLITIPMTA
jgi:signal transduction histidine kinase